MGVYQLGPATRLTPADVSALWVSAGGDPAKAPIAVGIVFGAENPAGNAGLVNDTPATGDYSVGLWQINYYGGLLTMRSAQFGSPEDFAADPSAQARAAIAMSRNGTNWAPWGPDLGYSGYGQAVTEPLEGSKVARWLAANMPSAALGAGTPAWLVPAAIAGVVLTAAGAAAALIVRFGPPPLPRLRFAETYDNPAKLPPMGTAYAVMWTSNAMRPGPWSVRSMHRTIEGARRAWYERVQGSTGRDDHRIALVDGRSKPGDYAHVIEWVSAPPVAAERDGAGGHGPGQRSMTVQSLLFPRSQYNVPEAKRWARTHGYRTDQVELTDKYIHLVQMPTAGLSVIRTIEFGSTGIKAHVGREAA
jgi:hypothetical protein